MATADELRAALDDHWATRHALPAAARDAARQLPLVVTRDLDQVDEQEAWDRAMRLLVAKAHLSRDRAASGA